LARDAATVVTIAALEIVARILVRVVMIAPMAPKGVSFSEGYLMPPI
jgi:hypothetical protein